MSKTNSSHCVRPVYLSRVKHLAPGGSKAVIQLTSVVLINIRHLRRSHNNHLRFRIQSTCGNQYVLTLSLHSLKVQPKTSKQEFHVSSWPFLYIWTHDPVKKESAHNKDHRFHSFTKTPRYRSLLLLDVTNVKRSKMMTM